MTATPQGEVPFSVGTEEPWFLLYLILYLFMMFICLINFLLAILASG